MKNELDPIVDQWYWHHDKGQNFYVTAVDEDEDLIEVQHFDGDVEEYSFQQWRNLDIELAEEPENFSGALDIGEKDDLGTEVSDTQDQDWEDEESDFRTDVPVSRNDGSDDGNDYGEGYAEEEPLENGYSDVTQSAPTRAVTSLQKNSDGIYEERFSDKWYAEYSEMADSGMWRADVFKHDVPQWHGIDYESLEEARHAAQEYYDQL